MTNRYLEKLASKYDKALSPIHRTYTRMVNKVSGDPLKAKAEDLASHAKKVVELQAQPKKKLPK